MNEMNAGSVQRLRSRLGTPEVEPNPSQTKVQAGRIQVGLRENHHQMCLSHLLLHVAARQEKNGLMLAIQTRQNRHRRPPRTALAVRDIFSRRVGETILELILLNMLQDIMLHTIDGCSVQMGLGSIFCLKHLTRVFSFISLQPKDAEMNFAFMVILIPSQWACSQYEVRHRA